MGSVFRDAPALQVEEDFHPDAPALGAPIALAPPLEDGHRWLVHAGTQLQDGVLCTAGGRVATLVAQHDTVAQACAHAYAGLPYVTFAGCQVRPDIGEQHA